MSIWAVPRHGNLVYLENQPEHINIRHKINEIFNELFGESLPIEYAKRIGKCSPGENRRILIKMSNYSDKQKVLSQSDSNHIFSNYIDKSISNTNKTFADFCKRSLNITKFASNTATQFELGCKPIDNKMFCLAVKYWLRLANGTSNLLLNMAYTEAVEQNFDWIQGIQFLMCSNSFGDVWRIWNNHKGT